MSRSLVRESCLDAQFDNSFQSGGDRAASLAPWAAAVNAPLVLADTTPLPDIRSPVHVAFATLTAAILSDSIWIDLCHPAQSFCLAGLAEGTQRLRG